MATEPALVGGHALRRVRAVRYVMPLREGGSLPALVEGDDLGLYVLKFRGAGQGPLALVAELVSGTVARTLGLAVPELVLLGVDPELGRNEPDAEIRDLLKRSVGWNVGMDFLPGARMFDPAAGDTASPAEASLIVWFDAFLANVDRTARNPNLLLWHRSLRLIDHGATLFWQHDWNTRERAVTSVFPASRSHVLLPWATDLRAADRFARDRLNEATLRHALAEVPAAWLLPDSNLGRDDDSIPIPDSNASPDSNPSPADLRRAAYVDLLSRRLHGSAAFTEEAERARTHLA